MDLLKRDPGQILRPLDTPESQPIKAAGEVGEALLEERGNSHSREALGLVDDAGAIAEHQQIGFARGARHLERVEQSEPFGIPARSFAEFIAEMDRSTQDRSDFNRARIGAASAVEIDLGQRANDQARTNVPSLRRRRAACSSISAHSPGPTPPTATSIGKS